MQAGGISRNTTGFLEFLQTPVNYLKNNCCVPVIFPDDVETAETAGILKRKKIIPIDSSVPRSIGIEGSLIELSRERKTGVDEPPKKSAHQKEITALSLESFRDISKESYAILEQFIGEHPNIQFLFKEYLGESFSHGTRGHLFSAILQREEVLYKLITNLSGSGTLEFKPAPNHEKQMIFSFNSIGQTISFLENIKNSRYFPKFLGIIYIASKNQFGWVFEKIQGENLKVYLKKNNFKETKNPQDEMRLRIQIMLDIAQGLKEMEKAGRCHSDLKLDNLMIRHSDKRGLIVDHEDSLNIYPQYSCIRDFCDVLCEFLRNECVRMPENIRNLVDAAFKPNSWDGIIESLSKTLASQI